ncbi:hypothetical protein ACSIGC_08810 [Tenacibaculum sp. ZS6-P6]|uniref:hypothetical protein n=1 Tax=Tenacibaculum sp. ZS6-P6 TaxID=3447503 RepID=UPI003F9AC568
MQDKQNFNGNRGETRTKAILSEYFYVSERSVDIDGADFIVEIIHNSIQSFRDFKEQGIVQAKYFEKSNQVKIAKAYIEDIDGLRTNFFAFLHTNDENGNKTHYFFTASQIKKEFRLKKDPKNSKDYYIFNLTKTKKFKNYKNLDESKIFRTIKEGILATEKYSRIKLIKEIEEKFKNPKKNLSENNNQQLFDAIKNKHIVEKLHICLNEYKEFRRITSWKLIDKITFLKRPNTHTYYNSFQLCTNNEDIISFFESIEIKREVKITNKKLFNNIQSAEQKVKEIINILNDNLIFQLNQKTKNKITNIELQTESICDCIESHYRNLNFHLIAKKGVLVVKPNNLWDSLKHSLTLTKIGEYDLAKKILNEISKLAKEEKQLIIYFVSKYNLRKIALKQWDEIIPDLNLELETLNISNEYFSILNGINNGNFSGDYHNSIDEYYSQIKDYKQRRSIHSTLDIAKKIYYRYGEYINFIDGNYIHQDNIYDKLTEKVIESLIISYSMTNDHTNHFNEFNDFIIEKIIHNCEPDNLLKYIQRNNISELPYHSLTNYINTVISNLFSIDNITFLESEITYIDNRSKNKDLRKTIERIFQNLCILIAYLKADFDKNLLNKVIIFIERLDFSIHELSLLSYPLLKKPYLFSCHEIIKLINLLIDKKLTRGFLITNAIYSLNEKGYMFKNKDFETLTKIFNIAIENSEYGILKALKTTTYNLHQKSLESQINQTLNKKFNKTLFYNSVISKHIRINEKHLNEYIESNYKLINNSTPYLSTGKSSNTGIPFKFREPLNQLITVLYILDEKKILSNHMIKKIREFHSYYNFILDFEKYTIPTDFNINWLLENKSDVVLNKISQNKKLKLMLKQSLFPDFNKEFVRLYIDYFDKN